MAVRANRETREQDNILFYFFTLLRSSYSHKHRSTLAFSRATKFGVGAMFGLSRLASALLLTAAISVVSGCGTQLPDIVTSSEPHATAFLINKILNHAKCELRDAVITAHNRDLENKKRYGKRSLTWLDTATAKITIKLIGEEKGSLNPGVSFKQLLPSVVTNFSNKTSVTSPQSSSV
jgi:hypothetical protein